MNRLPRKISSLVEVIGAFNELIDHLAETTPLPSSNTLLHRSTRGALRSALAFDVAPAGDGGIQFKGKWDASVTYTAGDIVTVDPDEFPDNAGTYLANSDIPAGQPMPAPYQVAGVTLADWGILSYFPHTQVQLDSPITEGPSTTPVAGTQRAILSAKGANGSPLLQMLSDATKPDTAGAVVIDLSLIVGFKLYLQKLVVCGPNGPKQRWFLCSDEFDLGQ